MVGCSGFVTRNQPRAAFAGQSQSTPAVHTNVDDAPVAVFGAYKGEQEAAPNVGRIVELLEAGCELLPFLVTEYAWRGAGGNNKLVIGDAPFLGQRRISIPVTLPSITVALRFTAQDRADWRGDIGRRPSSGGTW